MAETNNNPNVMSSGVETSKGTSPQGRGDNVPQARPCPKDCSKCSWGHQVYCTAKMTFDSFSVMNSILQGIEAMTAKVDAQSAVIADLCGRIAAMESEHADFSTPAPIQTELFADQK